MKHRHFVIPLLFLLLVVVVGCNDDNPVGQDGSAAIYPSITYTDETGTVVGGDGTDWCYENDTHILPRFAMYPPYPNPFNGTTIIRFELPAACHVNIKVRNTQWGFEAPVIDADLPTGVHEVEWSATDFPGGYYECYMTAGDFACQGTLLVLRIE